MINHPPNNRPVQSPDTSPDNHGDPSSLDAQRVPAERIARELLVSAAMRIVPGPVTSRRVMAERFLAGAEVSDTDLSRTFGVVDRSVPAKPWVRQACFAIPGPGRTAMLLVSGPIGSGLESEQDHFERVSSIRAAAMACEPDKIRVVQALPETEERSLARAFVSAGFLHVGDLAYLERHLPSRPSKQNTKTYPPGVSVRPMQDIQPGSPDRRRLAQVLEASYTDTLDCPELCGLRDTEDIIESHAATGTLAHAHWRLAFRGTTPIGCVLVSEIPESGTAELVYLGLAPEARKLGIGRTLVENAILGLSGSDAQRMVCAVDRRNLPAARLYESLGFIEFSGRTAFVRTTERAEEDSE